VANIPTTAIEFPLVHPPSLSWDIEADEQVSKLFFRMPNLFHRIIKHIQHIISN